MCRRSGSNRDRPDFDSVSAINIERAVAADDWSRKHTVTASGDEVAALVGDRETGTVAHPSRDRERTLARGCGIVAAAKCGAAHDEHGHKDVRHARCHAFLYRRQPLSHKTHSNRRECGGLNRGIAASAQPYWLDRRRSVERSPARVSGRASKDRPVWKDRLASNQGASVRRCRHRGCRRLSENRGRPEWSRARRGCRCWRNVQVLRRSSACPMIAMSYSAYQCLGAAATDLPATRPSTIPP